MKKKPPNLSNKNVYVDIGFISIKANNIPIHQKK
jgi:hypothetical protein